MSQTTILAMGSTPIKTASLSDWWQGISPAFHEPKGESSRFYVEICQMAMDVLSIEGEGISNKSILDLLLDRDRMQKLSLQNGLSNLLKLKITGYLQYDDRYRAITLSTLTSILSDSESPDIAQYMEASHV